MIPLLRDGTDLTVVEATLLKPVVEDHLLEAQSDWPPILRRVVAEYMAANASSDVKIWQGHWGQKTPQLADPAASIQGIHAKGRVQGLIKMLVQGQPARLATGGEIIYVDLVEAAPWNVGRYMKVLAKAPLLKDVGSELMRTAVKESRDRGFDGRVGLHSLKRAEAFYDAIGMTKTSPDPAKSNLVYYEFTENDANKFYGDKR